MSDQAPNTEDDPVPYMLAHALYLIGDDPKRAEQAKQFAKEFGPILRKAWDASFLSDEEYWGDALPHHLENIAKARQPDPVLVNEPIKVGSVVIGSRYGTHGPVS
jgi:hypothetical protein